MPTLVTPLYGTVHIPPGINDLPAFRRWVHSASLPEKLPIHFLQGDVWVDGARSDSLNNVFIRGALVATIYGMAKADRLGFFATAGVLWSNDKAEFATLPDAFFISNEAFEQGRVRFSNGGNPLADASEVIGTPDIVVELVSDVSEEKDTKWVMGAYSTAGVPEYWLIDARGERLRFDVFSLRSKGYVARRKTDGWVKSSVLAREFQLVRGKANHGFPNFHLEVR